MPATPRILVAMIDALDLRFFEAGHLPRLRALAEEGAWHRVQAVLPTVTNANNVSIACATWPAQHGITGNSYFDAGAGRAEYMEDAGSLTWPTMLQRVADAGGKAALLTSKVKSTSLLGAGAEVVVAAERPSEELVARYGPAPEIYSAEINHWLWTVAGDLLAHRPDLDLIYVHTTDYPMHAWRPDDPRHLAHLARLDELIAEAVASSPDVALYATGDHGMNDKRICWDLATACANRGTPVRFALSAERDRYLRHHLGYGGTTWIWLERPSDAGALTETLLGIPGVEAVLPRAEAAERFRLMPERIGELVVLADEDTVFGELGGAERIELEDGYRSHGSLHERDVPLIEYRPVAERAAAPEANVQLLEPLLDDWLERLAQDPLR
jgi:phosphonoacetate hydrolase